MVAKSGNSLAFFKPSGDRVAADAEDAVEAPNGRALVVSCKDHGFGLFIVGRTAGVVASILFAGAALEAQFAVFSVTVAGEIFATAVSAVQSGSKHRLILPHADLFEPLPIIIPGGSGQVGTVLARAFHQRGDEVVVLSRTALNQPWRVVLWDAETVGDWAAEIDGADAVINLAGRSVNCRYTPANRRLIIGSRVRSTQVIGEAIARSAQPPSVWLQASTATIYAHSYDAPNDDVTGVLGGRESGLPDTWRFSLDVARQWEEAAAGAHTPRTRKVLLRSAMIMSPDRAGVFDMTLHPQA